MSRKTILIVAVVIAAVGAYFLFFKKDKAEGGAPAQQPLAVSKNSASINTAFNGVLTVYDSLRLMLVDWNNEAAAQQAGFLQKALEQFPVKDLRADSSVVTTARSFLESAAAEAAAIAAEPDLEGKRRSFYTLSESLYNLARTVRYDQQVIYHVNCPMAFNDEEEAFWLSTRNEVVNPYLGTRHPKYKDGMLHCGEVKDSLSFR